MSFMRDMKFYLKESFNNFRKIVISPLFWPRISYSSPGDANQSTANQQLQHVEKRLRGMFRGIIKALILGFLLRLFVGCHAVQISCK
ncbi:hypothetical protein EYF80_034076 [Liparis tanakae]|uniref:Uncharacterized protein n=1 Tax=Liparis tanakae TaxID=230148 RepID=A0A4Z2GQY7_9TELE|nr:hypothetical protein EYF80_034076 [Liparis tanakae]